MLIHVSMDWFIYGKIYRKPWFLPSNIGVSCKFSHNPILWMLGIWLQVSGNGTLLPSVACWPGGKATSPTSSISLLEVHPLADIAPERKAGDVKVLGYGLRLPPKDQIPIPVHLLNLFPGSIRTTKAWVHQHCSQGSTTHQHMNKGNFGVTILHFQPIVHPVVSGMFGYSQHFATSHIFVITHNPPAGWQSL